MGSPWKPSHMYEHKTKQKCITVEIISSSYAAERTTCIWSFYNERTLMLNVDTGNSWI